jgi:3-methyladenine DNA glycosylase Mpg
MIRTQIYIPEEIHYMAKVIAKTKEEPLARLLRNYIAKGIKEEKNKLKSKSLTSIARLNITKGPKNLSRNMDKYLYKK